VCARGGVHVIDKSNFGQIRDTIKFVTLVVHTLIKLHLAFSVHLEFEALMLRHTETSESEVMKLQQQVAI